MVKEDFYQLLGIAREADNAAIERAVAGAMSVTHDSARRALLRHARDTLLDTQLRWAYDRTLRAVPTPSPHLGNSAPAWVVDPARAASRATRPAPLQEPASSGIWKLWAGMLVMALILGGLGYFLSRPKHNLVVPPTEVLPITAAPAAPAKKSTPAAKKAFPAASDI